VPPLHARFLGAVYLSAALVLAWGLSARRQAEVRMPILLVTVWTGLLMVLSLFHLDVFDWSHKPVWFWFGAYALYPAVGVCSLWAHGWLRRDTDAPVLPTWAQRCLLVAGAAMVVLALLLLLAPVTMTGLWPWKISPLLAQIYSAPFVAYGLCLALLGRGRTWPEARIVVRGASAFAALVLLASIRHWSLFDPARVATWVWFGGFSSVLLLFLGLQLRFRSRGTRP
jgi:hypothetical protein